VATWQQNAVTAANVENFALQPSFLLRLHDVTKN
jgi:peptide/nickel transport system substrate-binding protein